MRETMIPLSVVKELLEMQNKYNEAQLKLLGEYLEKAAIQYEKALNPPLPITSPRDDELFANPRMSEDEEDLRYALKLGDITEEEYKKRLNLHLDGAYEDPE